MSWIDSSPDRWSHEREVAKSLFKEVTSEVTADGCASIYGVLYCERRHLLLGPFFIRVLYPPDFPAHDPNIFLLSHEAWRCEAYHIESNGRFCWTEVKDSKIDFMRSDSLKLLVENISFRLVQAEIMVRTQVKKYPGPERSHFGKGETEAKIDRKRRGIGPNTKPCVCGANKKYKHCHGRKEVFVREV